MADGRGLGIRGWSQAACARESSTREGEGGVSYRTLSRSLFPSLSPVFSPSPFLFLTLTLSPSLFLTSPTPLERARAFGFRVGVETRADSQSFAVRYTTWLESAVWQIEINDHDENDGDDTISRQRRYLIPVECRGPSRQPSTLTDT